MTRHMAMHVVHACVTGDSTIYLRQETGQRLTNKEMEWHCNGRLEDLPTNKIYSM